MKEQDLEIANDLFGTVLEDKEKITTNIDDKLLSEIKNVNNYDDIKKFETLLDDLSSLILSSKIYVKLWI